MSFDVVYGLMRELSKQKAELNCKGTSTDSNEQIQAFDSGIRETIEIVEEFSKSIVEFLVAEVATFKSAESESTCIDLANIIIKSSNGLFESQKVISASAVIIRLCSENRKFLQNFENAQELYDFAFKCIYLCRNDGSNGKQSSEGLLSKTVKIIRNLIFAKIGIRRKNFINDLLSAFQMCPDNKAVVTDLLRIFCKLSENQKIALKISTDAEVTNVIKALLSRWTSNNLIIALVLHFANNLIVVDSEFGQALYSPDFMGSLLKIFKEQTSNVSLLVQSFGR